MGEIKAIRKGRCAAMPEWKEQYKALLATPEKAAEAVRDNDVIAMTGGANMPLGFEQAMIKRAKANAFKHLDIVSCFHLGVYEFTKPEYKDIVEMYSIFFGGERRLLDQGNSQHSPMHLGETGRVVASRKPSVVSITCSPPNEDGWMSRGLWGMHMSREAYQNPTCRELAITVNRNMPFLYSEGERHLWVHVSEADYIIEQDFDLPEIGSKESTKAEIDIAGYIAEMIKDGDCIQFGQGGLADAIGNNLVYAGKKDLGLQTEVVTNCVANLMKAGVINNSRKTTYRGKSVGSAVVGDRSLWEFLRNNPDVVLLEIDWVNDPDNIRLNDNVISINNAMEIDLTGQVASEAVGARQYTGTGGQLQWVYGSQLSKNGRSVIAINSVYKDKEGQFQTKIKPTLPAGSVITTPRTVVQHVVTEYGVANLKFKGVKERAEALINIAHPDFRDKLRSDARKLGYNL
jgi:4-hydroxybutyrate CoA-transferase